MGGEREKNEVTHCRVEKGRDCLIGTEFGIANNRFQTLFYQILEKRYIGILCDKPRSLNNFIGMDRGSDSIPLFV